MALNGISTLATKELRQKAKLDLAALKRQGYTLYADGTTNSGSALFSGSNYLSIATSTAFGFDTGDFTLEGWYYHTAGGAFHVLFDFRTTITQVAIMVAVNTSDKIYLYVNGSIRTITTASLTADSWTHVALVRSAGTTRLWVNGVQSGTPYADTNDYGTTYPLHIGSDLSHNNKFVGNMSNIRIVKGTALYTATFTPSRSPFTAVTGTSLLLNTDNGAGFLTDSSANNFTVINTGTVVTSSMAPGPDTDAPFYRDRATYDLTQLPTQYNNNDLVNNPNAGGLVEGRPWITTTTPFTFYETTGTTTAISITRYVSGNKIYAESSTYDVPSYQPARVVVNDIQVVNTELRGHTLVVLDTYGDVVTTATQYDTWDTGGAPGARAALASALSAVTSSNIVVLVVYDASGLDAGIRSAINTGYGSTNTNTWASNRISHIFIGIKI
jgi:hypothetical protein